LKNKPVSTVDYHYLRPTHSVFTPTIQCILHIEASLNTNIVITTGDQMLSQILPSKFF